MEDAFRPRATLRMSRWRRRLVPIFAIVALFVVSVGLATAMLGHYVDHVQVPLVEARSQARELGADLERTRALRETYWRPEYVGQTVHLSLAGEPTRRIDAEAINALERERWAVSQRVQRLEAVPRYGLHGILWLAGFTMISGPLLLGLIVAPGRRVDVTIEQHRLGIDRYVVPAVDILGAHRNDRHLVIHTTREAVVLGPLETAPADVDALACKIRQLATTPLERAEERRARGRIEHDYRVRVASWLDRA